jgi:hypothetical protein
MTAKAQKPRAKADQDRQLSKALEATFPASDPPSATEPGGGVTGPEVVKQAPGKKG